MDHLILPLSFPSLTLLLFTSSGIGTNSSSEVSIGDQLETAPVPKAHQCTNRRSPKTIAKMADQNSTTAKRPLDIYSCC
jgi:hypothetical protein